MGERIENAELRPYVHSYIVKKLSSCDLFVKTFGKTFALTRLNLNFSKLYTNEKNRSNSGYYSSSDLSITICKEGKDGQLLSVKDLENNNDLKHTALHEGIHSVLRLQKLNCKMRKLKSGTGMLEHYLDGSELGRGLNEGLTNWICEQAGLEKSLTYITLTNFVKQIELGIGSKKTMQLAKGKIDKNISKLLGMNVQECRQFISFADEIYTLENKQKDVEFIIQTLSRVLDDSENDFIFGNSLGDDMSAINEIAMFANLKDNPDYLQFALSQNKDSDDLQTKLEYFKVIKENLKSRIYNTRGEFENIIFTKYFQREFQKINEVSEISDSDFKKFAKFSKLLQLYKKEDNSQIAVFQREFQVFKEKYIKGLLGKISSEIENGTFTISKFMEYKKIFADENDILRYDSIEFNRQLGAVLSKEHPDHMFYLILLLEEKGKLEDISQYSILDIGDGNTRRVLFSKNGEEMYSANGIASIQFLAEDKIENPKELFDFTLVEGQNIQEVVNKFLLIKEKMLKQDPKAKFKIINDVIIIQSQGQTKYIVIDKNDLVFVNAREEEDLSLKIAENKNIDLIQTEGTNPFTKFILKMKRKLLLKKSDSVYHTESQVPKNVESQENDFEKRIRDMSNYGDVPTPSKYETSEEITQLKDEFYK